MTLQAQILEDMKQAMKAKDMDRLNTIRLLRSEIKNVEIDHGEQDDAAVQKIVKKMVKQWQDAKVDYQKGKREDLVKEADARLEILNSYLPAQMSEEELKKVIQEVIAESGQSQIGPVIGMVMKKVGTQADGGMVSKLVKELIS